MKQWIKRLPVLLILMVVLVVSANSASAATTEDAVLEVLCQAYEDNVETVDLTEYGITVDQLTQIMEKGFRWGMFPWYFNGLTYTHSQTTGLVRTVTLINLDPEAYDYALYEQRVAEILAETVKPGMSDWQIALSIHDYLVAHNAYDETYTYNEGYDAIVRGSSVCQGYAEAYMDLLNRCGVPCRMARSAEMDHVWNVVYVSGHWLHVDATWDDPTTDTQGRVMHNYFLISDAALSENHYNWTTSVTCSYTGWDTDRVWHDVDSQFCYETNSICYTIYKNEATVFTLYRVDNSDGSWTPLLTHTCDYIDISGGALYHYGHYGFAMWNGRLYYSDLTTVYSVKTDGTDRQVVYTHPYSAQKTFIYGMYVDNGKLYLTLSNANRTTLTSKTVNLKGSYHTHSYSCVVTAATCVSGGYSTYTCSCGVSYTANQAPIDAAAHSYKTTSVKATCTEKGYDKHTCTRCGDSYVDNYTELAAHSYATTKVAATCKEKGYDQHTCTLCGDSYVDNYTELAAHSYGSEYTTVAPTCTSRGYDHYVCGVCGHRYYDNYVDMTGHSFSAAGSEEATCVKKGYDRLACDMCGKTETTNEVPALGHKYDDGQCVKEATETSFGIMRYTCQVCRDAKNEKIPMLVPSETTAPETKPQTQSGDAVVPFGGGSGIIYLVLGALVVIVVIVIVVVSVSASAKRKKRKAAAAAAAARVQVRFCTSCGSVITAGHQFCTCCGKKV